MALLKNKNYEDGKKMKVCHRCWGCGGDEQSTEDFQGGENALYDI